MNPIPQLTPHLKQLRLSGILDSLEVRNRQAVEQKLAYTDFLALLIEDEIARREQRKLVMRQRRAGINTQKTLESYDFTFNLGVNQAQIMDLATCRYLEEKVPVLIVGPCGTGKSHLAQALGHIAVRRGYDTVFTSHAKLLGQLASARAVGTYERKLAELAGISLQNMGEIERGKGNPTLITVEKLSSALGEDLSSIFDLGSSVLTKEQTTQELKSLLSGATKEQAQAILVVAQVILQVK